MGVEAHRCVLRVPFQSLRRCEQERQCLVLETKIGWHAHYVWSLKMGDKTCSRIAYQQLSSSFVASYPRSFVPS
jgi:hypothetical protein